MKKFLPEDIYVERDVLYIDVRTPMEFNEDTIYGAVNIPLFTDEQREEIGTIYKQVNKRKAIELGYKYGGARLQDYFTFVQQHEGKYHKFVIMCFRGGGRSSFVGVNLALAFGNIYQLEGGYKGYRNYILANIEKEIDSHEFLVLSGKTGVGKTRILSELKKQGYPVLDLEGYANNRGSMFGDIGLQSNTRKKFDSLLFNDLKESKSKLMLIEGESKRIGNIYLPNALITNMDKGVHLNLTTTMEQRISNILNDYGLNRGALSDDEKEIIIGKILNLKQKLGSDTVQDLIFLVKSNKYQKVVEHLINYYYDPLYQYKENQYQNIKELSYETMDEGVELVKESYNKISNKT